MWLLTAGGSGWVSCSARALRGHCSSSRGEDRSSTAPAPRGAAGALQPLREQGQLFFPATPASAWPCHRATAPPLLQASLSALAARDLARPRLPEQLRLQVPQRSTAPGGREPLDLPGGWGTPLSSTHPPPSRAPRHTTSLQDASAETAVAPPRCRRWGGRGELGPPSPQSQAAALLGSGQPSPPPYPHTHQRLSALRTPSKALASATKRAEGGGTIRPAPRRLSRPPGRSSPGHRRLPRLPGRLQSFLPSAPPPPPPPPPPSRRAEETKARAASARVTSGAGPATRSRMPATPEASLPAPAAAGAPGPPPPAGRDGHGAAAPMETNHQAGPSVRPPPSCPQVLEDEFQFVLCEGCQQESPNLKLLTCLHTLCLGCLNENKPIGQCPVCWTAIPQASGIPDRDNLLFTSLQARLSIYKKIISSGDLSCSRCRKEVAAVWCSECEEFLCLTCFEAHQWFFKKRSHEARKVEDLRAESAHQFLEGTRKSCNLFCSSPGHTNQGHVTSIYCRRCEKPLCCSCALLDSKHSQFYCDIRTEIQRRQEELGTMSRELKQRKSGFEDAYKALRDEVAHLEQVSRETREQIQQRVEQLVRLIRQEEEELLGLVETRREQGRRELAGELRRVEGVLRRMEAGERLVEKMSLYATEQEVMDMQPFIKDSLEELRRLQPTAAGGQVQATRDFAECRGRLQALAERVMGQTGGASQAVPVVEVALENDLQEEPDQVGSQGIVPTFTISLGEMQASTASPAATQPKWRSRHMERGSQSSPKLLKLECDNEPALSNSSLNQWDGRGGPSTSAPSQNCSSIPATKASRNQADDTEVTSIIICSSEDSEEDTVVFGEPSGLLCSGSSTAHHGSGSASPWGYGPGLSTLVFFNLKVDQKTQQIMQIAAANGDHSFKTVIQTPESVLPLLSQGVPLETAMEQLLWYLHSVPRPILVIYNFWAPELSALFKALDATAKKVDFCHTVGGYLDMLPMIKEKFPKAPSYKLKNLLRKHLRQQLNEGSALATAKALQGLGEALELFSCPDPGPLFTHCNLQSYTVLRTLIQEKLLTKRAAKILARRNLILWELEQA
ncbi:protein PML-like isoform X2 [Dromaius novaehollandiae]|uniref:protein PML-like isoform X2 n=1 Tax=Dromaius novaehollandiae TaxID=8790 RepID=UPI00311EBF74